MTVMVIRTYRTTHNKTHDKPSVVTCAAKRHANMVILLVIRCDPSVFEIMSRTGRVLRSRSLFRSETLSEAGSLPKLPYLGKLAVSGVPDRLNRSPVNLARVALTSAAV